MLKLFSFPFRFAFSCLLQLFLMSSAIEAQNLPAAFHAGTLGREAVTPNAALSPSYWPRGGEQDVSVYTVTVPLNPNGVVINEILASNSAGATDEAGDHDDWLELYNNNNFAVNLGGYFVTDDPTLPTQWQIPPGTSIAANGYLILWADNQTDQGPLHTNWKISAGGESLQLLDASQNIVDSVTFGQQITDMGYARVPNGTGAFIIQATTFNANNTIQHNSNGVVINEILATNVDGATDEAGDHEDWVELYNNNNFNVDLSGFHLSDDGGILDKWIFPPSTVITAHDYLIVWADNEGTEGPLHASWKISNGGESVTFSDPLLQILDQVAFGNLGADTAYARIPNGTGNFIQQAPTFDENNETISSTSEITFHNISLYPNPGSDEVRIKIENDFLGDSYYITDLTGRIVLTGILFQNLNSLDISSLAPGQYFCVIKDRNPITLRFLKI